MRNVIASYESCIGFLVAMLVVAGIEFSGQSLVYNYSTTWQGICNASGWEVRDGDTIVRLHLACGERKSYTDQADVVVGHLYNPGMQLACKVYKSGDAKCELVAPKR